MMRILLMHLIWTFNSYTETFLCKLCIFGVNSPKEINL